MCRRLNQVNPGCICTFVLDRKSEAAAALRTAYSFDFCRILGWTLGRWSSQLLGSLPSSPGRFSAGGKAGGPQVFLGMPCACFPFTCHAWNGITSQRAEHDQRVYLIGSIEPTCAEGAIRLTLFAYVPSCLTGKVKQQRHLGQPNYR